MAEIKNVQGGCHCGAVRFEASIDLSSTMECNCSHCAAKGFVLTFTPAENFKITSGEDRLTENITINFAEVEYAYTPQKDDGTGDTALEYGWNIEGNEQTK